MLAEPAHQPLPKVYALSGYYMWVRGRLEAKKGGQ